MKDFSPDLFMSITNTAYMYSDRSQRYGQFLYNQFREKYPDVIIPDRADCFYNNKNVNDFIVFVYSLGQ